MSTPSERQVAGKHDFNEATPLVFASMSTTSVGIFQWIPAKSGGLKRSGARVRVRGSAVDVEPINATAREIASQLDAGTYSGPKTVIVGKP